MRKEESERITAEIAALITNQAPYVNYTSKDIKKAKRWMSEEQASLLKEAGILTEDFELFYVLNRFLGALKLEEKADYEYKRALFQNAKKFGVSECYENPYIKLITVPEVRVGDYLLTNVSYDRGEFFQYDMPDFSVGTVVPKLGFFIGKVRFPSIYEGRIPWMSVCPSEISSMKEPIDKAYGRVLVLGLGLGYYPFMISLREEVCSVTIIERQPEIIQIFREYLLPQFQRREIIQVIESDAFDYLDRVEEDDYDFCFADIWENQVDGAEAYKKIKERERRLPDTKFMYWIEDSICWYLNKK